MELGEHPRKFLLRVDQMVKELERVDRPVDAKDVDIVTLSGLTSQHDAEVRMLESSSDWPTREWIERVVVNQYERLESEKSAAGTKAMIAHGNGRNPSLHARCPLCSRTGHAAQDCREYRVTKREPKPKGMRHDGDAGNRGSGNHRGGGGTRQKDRNANNWDSEDKTDRPGCYFCQGPHKSSECPNRSSAAAATTASSSQHGGFLGCTRNNLGTGLFASADTRSALPTKAPGQLLHRRHSGEHWVNDSGATENMT